MVRSRGWRPCLRRSPEAYSSLWIASWGLKALAGAGAGGGLKAMAAPGGRRAWGPSQGEEGPSGAGGAGGAFVGSQ